MSFASNEFVMIGNALSDFWGQAFGLPLLVIPCYPFPSNCNIFVANDNMV